MRIMLFNHDVCMGVMRGEEGNASLLFRKWDAEVVAHGKLLEY